MTYLKTLIALTMFALLTACAGGVTVNNAFGSDDPKTTESCVTNPFGKGCTVPTEQETEAFCRDASKTPNDKETNCAVTVNRVCGENPFDTGLCFAGTTYAPTRVEIRATCTNADGANPPRHALCPTIVTMTCTENPFLAECLVGDAGAETGTYGLERAKQIDATCPNDVHDIRCHGVQPYEGQRQQILSNCEANVGTGNACPANVVMQVCLGNPYNTILCNDPAIDYTAQRMERLTACKGTNTLAGCAEAAATTCPANPFQTGICFIDNTYMPNRDTQTQNCRNKVADAPNCPDALIAVCNADKFDAFCTDAPAYRPAQLNECALATATLRQCKAVFVLVLAECLADPFSVGCDAEPTFTDDKASVRAIRFNYCETAQPNDDICTGYRTCNISVTFAPLTCGTDFNPKRMEFCAVTANAFDPLCTANNLTDTTAQMAYCMVTTQAFDAGCVGGLKNTAAQLEFCKLPGTNPFTGDCDNDDFTEARVEFCKATPATEECNEDARNEGLMKATVVVDPCAGLSTDECVVDIADLPTYQTAPAENAPVTDDFADGILSVTLIAPTGGKSLLNPDGTENTTISTTTFPTGTTVQEGNTRIRRRGGRGSIDADGFISFGLLKAGAESEANRTSTHAAILSTTNLGRPLASPPTTALWPGHFYSVDAIFSTDFFVTFDGTAGTIGFANVAGTGIGLDMDRRGDAETGDIKTTGETGIFDVTFGADGVLSGKGSFSSSVQVPLTGLIGAEGAIGFFIAQGGFAGFTATNPDGGALPVFDPCVGGLAACYGTHAFWLSNARDSENTGFLTIKSAGTADKNIDAPNAYLIAGGADAAGLLNFNNPDPVTTAILNLSGLDESLDGSNDANSGFSALRVFDSNGWNYAGLLSGTNVGAPFTDANQPAAEWTAIIQLATTRPSAPFTLDVAFTGGAGTIKTKAGEAIAFPDDNDSNTDATITVDGKFDSNGVIYGGVLFTDLNFFIVNVHGTLSGLIGVNGAVGVFTDARFAGGFVARPKPASGG